MTDNEKPGVPNEGVVESTLEHEQRDVADVTGTKIAIRSVSDSPNETGSTLSSGARLKRPLYLAAIGASAGGLQSLEEFFRSIPSNTGIAFVVIQHLSPDFKSLMQELLARHTDMPVKRVEDGMRLLANTVYLIPPRKNMTVKDGCLCLKEQSHRAAHKPNFPIDLFFRSIASAYSNRAIGIILSGTGSDGSRGVRAIDEEGGLIFVESTDSAQFDGMPNAAICTGTAKDVMPPADIATALSEIAVAGLRGLSMLPDPTSSDFFHKIVALVSDREGIEFRQYKPSTISRRLERRRLIAGPSSLAEYYELIKKDPGELRALRNDLLVSVTAFFRDDDAWRKLQEVVIPELLQSITIHETIRIWVNACATGEEAYTMAIVIRESLEAAGRSEQKVKIFATDVDEKALAQAAQAIYPSSIVADIPVDLLNKYFKMDNTYFRVRRPLREMIIFAPHNLICDAPFTRTHIVSCRNALIYLEPPAQRDAIGMLHFSLKEKGVLFLGASETTGDHKEEFKVVDQKWNLHTKIRNVRLTKASGFPPRIPSPNVAPIQAIHGMQNTAPSSNTKQVDSLSSTTLSILAESNSEVYLVCDKNFMVQQTIGDSRHILNVPEGAMTNEVTKLVPKSLAAPLTTAMHRSRCEAECIKYHGINVSDIGSVDMQVTYRKATTTTSEMYVVSIKQAVSDENVESIEPEVNQGLALQRLRDQELELQHTRESLQSTIEQLETTNQIHQSTNEQLTTANEELQSTNEELHSVNEELYTVNSEYQTKIGELTELNNDIDNLLESTEIGVVFLDNDLNIRKFTPAATHSVSLRSNDIGRPFEELNYNFDYPQLAVDIRRVISLGEAIEREAAVGDSKFCLVRIHPYRAGNELTIGVVISFIDISELKNVEDALAQVEVRYRHLFQSKMFGIAVSNIESRAVIDANNTLLDLIGSRRANLPLKHRELFPEKNLSLISEAMNELMSSGTTPPTPTLLLAQNGETIPVIISRTLISQKDGTYVSFVLDASELVQKDQEIQHKTDEMEVVSEDLQQFAYIASHELLEPMRSISGYSQLLEQKYADAFDERGAQFLKFIMDSAIQMDRVINDLLLFSRVQTKGGGFQLLNFNLLLDELSASLVKEHDDINIEFSKDVTPYIYADEGQIRQLLSSLFDNSIKFRSNDTVKIEIDAVELEKEWQFSIQDNGIGISTNNRDNTESIFAIFRRLHTRDAYPGSGVGLAISRRIVERHKGRIWAESVEDTHGTKVTFTIPICDEEGKNALPHPKLERL